MLYQYYLPANPVIRDTDPAPQPWTPYVFAPLGDPDLVAAGAELLWRDPGVSIGLWEEPAPTDGSERSWPSAAGEPPLAATRVVDGGPVGSRC